MKLIKCLISLFVFSALLIIMPAFAARTPHPGITVLDKTHKIVLVTKVKHIEHTRIATIYPKLLVSGSEDNAFNREIAALLKSVKENFLKAATDGSHPKSTLNTNYTLYQSTFNQHPVISVLLETESSITGYAHPSHPLASITYDLTQGKVLELNELFKPDSNYLQVLADYSKKELLERNDADQIKDFITAGTKPVMDNFKVWNLTSKGLLITFPEYAVAPYYYGKQQVLIPFTALPVV